MQKNRFFKSTIGKDVDFAFGSNLPVAGSTTDIELNEVIASSAVGRLYLWRVAEDDKQPYAIVVNTGLSAALKAQPIYVGYVVGTNSDGTYRMRYTSPMIGTTIKATVNAYAAAAAQVTECVNSGLGTISTQQTLSFKVIELTPQNNNLPIWDYEQPLIYGEAQAWTDIAAKINARRNDEFFTAVASATGITITSTDYTRSFKLTATIIPTKADPDESGVTYTYTTTTAQSLGIGTLDQVEELWKQAQIRDGVGTQYTHDSLANPAEFGAPLTVAGTIATTQFDMVTLRGVKSEWSPTPREQHNQEYTTIIAVPSGEGAKIAAIFA